MESREVDRRDRRGGRPSNRQAREVSADTPLVAAFAAIDRAHAADPARFEERPRELDYAERMTRWIGRLAPDAPAPLLLAARGQHLRRWEIPRAAYPMTRAGYHAWRKAQAEAHAGAMRKILAAAGFEEAVIERTASLLRKERLGSDPEVAALEDAACLVFLERDLDDFAARHDEEKVIGILRKTWGKMSPRGQEEARRLLPNLAAPARALVERALA